MAVNAAKREIDDASSALEAKRVEGGPPTADVLDSEEHQLLQTLKASKIKFRRYITLYITWVCCIAIYDERLPEWCTVRCRLDSST